MSFFQAGTSLITTTIVYVVVFMAFCCKSYVFSQGTTESTSDKSGDVDATISFDQQIRPLLSDRCYACHGPDGNSREADLRLDQQEAAHEYAIVPGSPEESEVWLRSNSEDPDMIMPPSDAHKTSFNQEQKELIKQWILEGAKYESFWAFVPPRKPVMPASVPKRWDSNPIDALVWEKLSRQELEPQSAAEPRTLIRRLSLDLTGLPPTRSEVHDFLEQRAILGPELAWEKLVDRLLDSIRYGEHIGRNWLDLVRYADTNGMHKDFYRNHFAYRDWVIQAFNKDIGYNQFLKDQLAGDLYDNPTPEQLTATAFNRLHLIIDRGTALPEESFHKNVIDRVTAVGTAFMGMTVQCAQCHDHKYDPISQKEFYSLYAFFNNIDANPETVAFPKNGLQPPYISLANDQQKEILAKFDEQLAEIQQELQTTKAALNEAANTGQNVPNLPDERSDRDESNGPTLSTKDDLGNQLKSLEKQRKLVQRKRDNFDRNVPYAMVMKERETVRPTFVKIRGQYDIDGQQVNRTTPAFLPPLNAKGETPTRLDLANWLIDPKHPLTSRVAVNRIWQQLFGIGLVKTSEDFGAQGQTPSHPELLDYLALSLVENDWKFKPLIKSIVMSKTYRQSSVASPAAYRTDPDNRQLARGSRYRLDAEVLRDQILLTSGKLVEQIGGPSVKPPQPPGLWQAVTMINERYQADLGDQVLRRSVYTFWKRGMPPPQMTILNAPTRDACIARRERTNTPSQALLLLNEPEYLKASRNLAFQVVQQPSENRIEFAWETVTCRLPDQSEKQTLEQLLADLTIQYQDNPSHTEKACEGLKLPAGISKVDLACWTVIISTIYNLDIAKNRD